MMLVDVSLQWGVFSKIILVCCCVLRHPFLAAARALCTCVQRAMYEAANKTQTTLRKQSQS